MYIKTYLVGLIYHDMSPVLACKGTDLVLSPGVQSPRVRMSHRRCPFCQPHCAAQRGTHHPWGMLQSVLGKEPCTVSLCDMSLWGHKVSWSQGELLGSREEGCPSVKSIREA